MTGVDQTLSGVHYVLGDVNKIYWYNSGTQFDPYRETIFYISALVPVVTIIFVILVKFANNFHSNATYNTKF